MAERDGKQRLDKRGRGRNQDSDSSAVGKGTLTETLASSHGQPLPASVREPTEARFGGADLSGVRVHFDASAEAAAKQLSARAFTIGQAIYFGEGQYNPESAAGSELLAHELVHTVQQKDVSVGADLDELPVSSPGDAAEHEAEGIAKSNGPAAPSKVAISSVSRAVIQRDLLDGGTPPPELHAPPQPINAQEPTPGEITTQTQTAIRQARSAGGANGVVNIVRQLRAGATDANRTAIESAINSELTDQEKQSLSGNAPPAHAANAPAQTGNAPAQPTAQAGNAPARPTNASAQAGNAPAHPGNAPAQPAASAASAGQAHAPPAGDAHPPTDANAHADPNAAQGDQPAHAPGGAGGQPGHDAQGAPGAHGPANAPHGQANGPANAHPQPGHDAAPGHGDANAHGDAEGHGHQPHIPEAAGRELIEQELAFHENWRVYAEHGAAGRAGHLLQTMFIADGNGSVGDRVLGGDLAQGAMGAGTQFLIGQGTRLLATRTIASRVPGVGNIIGGAFSAYALFSNGGAGITKLGTEAIHGIGGAFSAQNWAESPWLTAANLVTGIKSVLEIIGHVCNILSGLAYAFAAIAAVGGLLSVFFPPLAFLVPYIPVAINFGRACGGIATVCLAAANLISPIPPILRAIHLIFSDNDPIRLVGAEREYHEQAQGALAAYGSAKLNNVASGRGIRASARSAQMGEIREGAEHYRSAMGGNSAPTPGNFRAGVENTERAMGMGSGDSRTPAQQGRDYFNPESRAHANEASLEKQERRLAHDEANHAAAEARADRMQGRLDADPTAKNFRNAASAAETAERHEGIVAHQEHQVELAEFRTQIPSGQMGHHGIGGNSGDAADMARGRARENMNEPADERRAETANEAYHELTHGAEAPHAEHDARGHVVLPAAPGSLEEIDALDRQIQEADRQHQGAQANAAEARQVQQETHTQATGLQHSAQGVTQHVAQRSASSAAEQQRVSAQTNDMTARTTQASSTSQQGTTNAAGPIQGIASAARTVDGLLGRVPSNRFFDVSGAKNNVHQFVVGMDQITGAGPQQGQHAQQANAAVQQRNTQTGQAQSTHAQATAQGTQLASQMQADSGTAANASSQAAAIAAASQAHGQQQLSRAQQLRAQRQQKWQALLAWAANHRALREQAAGGGHH